MPKKKKKQKPRPRERIIVDALGNEVIIFESKVGKQKYRRSAFDYLME